MLKNCTLFLSTCLLATVLIACGQSNPGEVKLPEGNFVGDDISNALVRTAGEADALADKLEKAQTTEEASKAMQDSAVFFKNYNARINELNQKYPDMKQRRKKYPEEKRVLNAAFKRLGAITTRLATQYSSDPSFQQALQQMSQAMDQ